MNRRGKEMPFMHISTTRRWLLLRALGVAPVASAAAGLLQRAANAQERRSPDVPFVPTPQDVVDAMLKLGGVKKEDMLFDLGCGDGRIPVTAAKRLGTHGVGIDIDPERIKEAKENARNQGVSDLVDFRLQDLFEAEIAGASVVTLYLLPSVNLRLRPKLWRDLKVGTRVVSHSFDMGDWEPEKTVELDWRKLYFWTITEKNKRDAKDAG
jgi:SAM-dependent methyltransferase